VRSVDSLALAILRLLGEETRKERTAKVIAELPVDVATFLLNEKRDWIQHIEERDEVQLLLVANPSLETPNYSIRRVRDDQTVLPENTGASYTLLSQEENLGEEALVVSTKQSKESPAITDIMPKTPAPKPKPTTSRRKAKSARKEGLLARLGSWFGSEDKAEKPDADRQTEAPKARSDERRKSPGGQRRGRGRRSRTRRDDRPRQDSGPKSPDRRPSTSKSANRPTDAGDNSGQPPRRKRRRRRPSEANADQSSTKKGGADESDQRPAAPGEPASQASEKPADDVARKDERPADLPSAGKAQAKGPPDARVDRRDDDKAATGSASPANKPAEKPGESGTPSTSEDRPEPGNEASRDRRLPWEAPTGDTSGESYTVWSSGPSGGDASPNKGPGRDD
jgi:ribonuclease E